LLHIGVRSICACVAALAAGVALESAGRYVVGAVGAGPAAAAASLFVLETVRPKSSPGHSASPVRVASLGAGLAFEAPIQASQPPAPTSRDASFEERFRFGQELASFDDRFLFDRNLASFDQRFQLDQELASFNERFVGADLAVAERQEEEGGASSFSSYASLPSPDAGEHAAAQPATGRSTPRPSASSPPASAARKRVATAEPPKESLSPAEDDSRTAFYDIAARVVYLPNGRRLEAHSGLGGYMDDVRYVSLKGQGPTPPNTYKLVMREEPFHGVPAIRLLPVGDGKMFGRDGMLAHPYMLGPNGQSNGCVSFSDYPAFLDAYQRGEIDRLVVVEHLETAPGAKTASGWLPQFIRDFFRRS
jgi:hypothetical protein